jgi:hypothetical protein
MNSYPLIAAALGETEQQFIEFVERHARARDGERVWRIEQSLKRSEGLQPSSVQLETRFELSGPGVPDGYGRRTDIEAIIEAALDAMRAGRIRGRAVSEQI